MRIIRKLGVLACLMLLGIPARGAHGTSGLGPEEIELSGSFGGDRGRFHLRLALEAERTLKRVELVVDGRRIPLTVDDFSAYTLIDLRRLFVRLDRGGWQGDRAEDLVIPPFGILEVGFDAVMSDCNPGFAYVTISVDTTADYAVKVLDVCAEPDSLEVDD